MSAKPCTSCPPGLPVEPKIPGHPKWCLECWLLRQTAQVQLVHSERRLAHVPEPLRRARVPERDWPPGRRWCSGCQSFVRIADLRSGQSRCRGCAGRAQRDGYVKRTYDITHEEERAIWLAQGERDPICWRQVHSKRPAVDHDHKTMAVRGLLCPDNERGCNHAIIGSIEAACKSDLPKMIAMARRIVAYLEDPPAPHVLARLRGGTYAPREEPIPF